LTPQTGVLLLKLLLDGRLIKVADWCCFSFSIPSIPKYPQYPKWCHDSHVAL